RACISEEMPTAPETTVSEEQVRSIISRNASPDIPFEQSINPYRGCEHGCIYCYARPTHAWLGLSPGLDFESRLVAKTDAADVLTRELSSPGYVVKPITLGANTDPYQPIEKQRRITRKLLKVMLDFRHPVVIVTKSALVLRDIDLIKALARRGLCRVALSITTLDPSLKRIMEPRTASPARRLACGEELVASGVAVSLLLAPIIPAINDHEIEAIVAAAKAAGFASAGYVLLRLPHEVAPLFQQWLQTHFPDRAGHVMSLVRQTRGGKNYDAQFGQRQSGTGPVAAMIRQRFRQATRMHALDRPGPELRCDRFRDPGDSQIALF
ncbi:MAG: PA0069 family radical SAM protein, partial [Gammaproteobacteria bacterium]|nr:PA0069 family radical SAM protein [Gammaproteobacteria bacterium]